MVNRPVDHEINLEPGAKPFSRKPYRMSEAELTELRTQLEKEIEKGWIQPSQSAWGAPVLFAPKKDGGMRKCIDYRVLNKYTIKSTYPLPNIEECLDRLSGAKYFTSLDLWSGYQKVPMKPEDVHKTAFNTRYGQFEFRVMPFGLTNAPATFQANMNETFREFIDKIVQRPCYGRIPFYKFPKVITHS